MKGVVLGEGVSSAYGVNPAVVGVFTCHVSTPYYLLVETNRADQQFVLMETQEVNTGIFEGRYMDLWSDCGM